MKLAAKYLMFFVCALAVAVGIGLLFDDVDKTKVNTNNVDKQTVSKQQIGKRNIDKQNVDKPKVDTDKKTFGAESPAAVVQAFRTAAKEKKWDSALRMLTRQSEDYVVASLIMAANSGALQAEGQVLVAKYVDRDELQAVAAEMRKLPRGMEFTIAPKLAALIKEKGTFVSVVLDLFHDLKKEIWINDVRFAKDVQLENVKIQGKVAKGKIRMTLEGRSGSEDVIFRKIKDKWYLNYAPSA